MFGFFPSFIRRATLVGVMALPMLLASCNALDEIQAAFSVQPVTVADSDGVAYELYGVTQNRNSNSTLMVGRLTTDGELTWHEPTDELSFETPESLVCVLADPANIVVEPETSAGVDALLFGYMVAVPVGETLDDVLALESVKVVTPVPWEQLNEEIESDEVAAAPAVMLANESVQITVECPGAYGALDLKAGFNSVLLAISRPGTVSSSVFMTTDVAEDAFNWQLVSVPSTEAIIPDGDPSD